MSFLCFGVSMYKWNRRGPGHEVSSVGDKRFSAMFAKLEDGRTIEMHYQCDIKGYDPGGKEWRLGKGKPPLRKDVDLWKEYLDLWRQWAERNPNLIEELKVLAGLKNCTLTDCFAKTPINQARALAVILNERYIQNAG